MDAPAYQPDDSQAIDRRTGCRRALVGLAVVGGAFALLAFFWSPRYPYGWSHCCSKNLFMALHLYAESHGDRYPAGEACPEASLSLLYREKLCDADLLRGKIVPLAEVEAVLARGDLLGPDTCGWHYVEGLTKRDDPRIAIIWDKFGLGHNGESLRSGDHWIMLLHGDEKLIPASEWEAFLAEQQGLIKARVK